VGTNEQPLRTSFLCKTASAILEKEAIGGPQALTPDERTFLTVWNTEATFARGGSKGAISGVPPLEIAAAYSAIDAPRKAGILAEADRSSEPIAALEAAFEEADEDADRLLERFWFARNATARAEWTRRVADLPGLAWKLVCWTGSDWIVGFLLGGMCFGFPFAVFAWGLWGAFCTTSAFRQVRYASVGRTALIGLMIAASVHLQLFLFRHVIGAGD